MGIFGDLFKSTSTSELKEKVSKGAILLDVRTKEEYSSGHAKGSVNIPLDVLSERINSLKRNVPVVAVCASGARSSSAKSILRHYGFEAYSGGSWNNFNR